MTSKATKRKHVTKEVLDDYILPTGSQQIVKVVSSCGNNLHQVLNSTGDKFLVSMPTKFRRNVWIKRDDYVLVEPIEEGDKVRGEIVTILYKDQIKYIKDNQLWPKEFENLKELSAQMDPHLLPPSDSDSEEPNEDNLSFVNPNWPVTQGAPSQESDSEETDSVSD